MTKLRPADFPVGRRGTATGSLCTDDSVIQAPWRTGTQACPRTAERQARVPVVHRACATFASSLSVRGERQQRGDARAPDRVLQLALVQRARAGDAPRKDLAALGDELLQRLQVLVVDVLDLLYAELADALAAVEELLLAALLSGAVGGRAAARA